MLVEIDPSLQEFLKDAAGKWASKELPEHEAIKQFVNSAVIEACVPGTLPKSWSRPRE